MIESNKKNTVYIKLYINKDDPLEKLKAALLGVTPGNYIKTFKYFEDYKDNFLKNNKFLGYLRFLQYNSDLTYIAQNYLNPSVKNLKSIPSGRKKLRLPPISIANEKDMLVKCKEIAENCLKKYPQTYEEDLKLLESKTLTYNERNCIVYRSGEKKIYKDMIEMANISLELLGLHYEDAMKRYKMFTGDQEKPYASYIEKVLLPLINTGSA